MQSCSLIATICALSLCYAFIINPICYKCVIVLNFDIPYTWCFWIAPFPHWVSAQCENDGSCRRGKLLSTNIRWTAHIQLISAQFLCSRMTRYLFSFPRLRGLESVVNSHCCWTSRMTIVRVDVTDQLLALRFHRGCCCFHHTASRCWRFAVIFYVVELGAQKSDRNDSRHEGVFTKVYLTLLQLGLKCTVHNHCY